MNDTSNNDCLATTKEHEKNKPHAWRARSALKLLQLDETFSLFDNVTRVVDLCAAPGSWTQVVADRLSKTAGAKIVSVDLQPMAPIPGVIQILGDITKESTVKEILKSLGNEKAELVICDGAQDVTGLHELDEDLHSNLLLSAFSIATLVLSPGGNFVTKIFEIADADCLTKRMKLFFDQLQYSKPYSSRKSSLERYAVYTSYHPLNGYIPQIINPFNRIVENANLTGSEYNRRIIPYIISGDGSGLSGIRLYDYCKISPQQRVNEESLLQKFVFGVEKRDVGDQEKDDNSLQGRSICDFIKAVNSISFDEVDQNTLKELALTCVQEKCSNFKIKDKRVNELESMFVHHVVESCIADLNTLLKTSTITNTNNTTQDNINSVDNLAAMKYLNIN